MSSTDSPGVVSSRHHSFVTPEPAGSSCIDVSAILAPPQWNSRNSTIKMGMGTPSSQSNPYFMWPSIGCAHYDAQSEHAPPVKVPTTAGGNLDWAASCLRHGGRALVLLRSNSH